MARSKKEIDIGEHEAHLGDSHTRHGCAVRDMRDKQYCLTLEEYFQLAGSGNGAPSILVFIEVVEAWTRKEYLREKCKRVSESKAREVHPNLFRYLTRGGQ